MESNNTKGKKNSSDSGDFDGVTASKIKFPLYIYPETNIENIMAAPTALLGLPKPEAYEKAMSLLQQVGLSQKALSYPDELSGGQQQRIAGRYDS